MSLPPAPSTNRDAHATAAPWQDERTAYRAISGRDPRFDGRLYVGVLSTGIYCRPSCPARTPRPENCRYYAAAAAAVAAGFRACRRCRPDALPGTRQWDGRADLAARALRAIADGVVDEHGVAGLASRLHVSDRHLHRVLVTEVGASPLQLARTRRAQLARVLLDQTSLPMPDVAFAAGFASVRQFNDVMREEFGAAPSALRAVGRRAGAGPGRPGRPGQTRQGRGGAGPGPAVDDDRAAGDERVPVEGAELTLRLRHALPYDAAGWFDHVAHRAVPGLERVDARRDGGPRRVTRLVAAPGGPVLVEVGVSDDGGQVHAALRLARLDDLGGVVARLRRWLDLDADPSAVDAALADDALLGPLVAARPGLRVPGTVDPFELAVRAVLGQQVSTTGARTLAGRLVAELGADGPVASDGLRVFPTPQAMADAGPDRLRTLGLTGARAATLAALAAAVADGLPLDPAADRSEVRAALLALPGVGPWTADYVALRALGDPDVFPAGDLVLRRALAELPGGTGTGVTVPAAAAHARAWSPWRGYAAQHLWTAWAARGAATRARRDPTPAARRDAPSAATTVGPRTR
ncbi:DNA-3-methyladenine glycosylase [Cellulomonas aerilata]|uniref:DNA-3-methyladenine glycosylase II n=1 Tax=Cellulomonas aerilata TaxID=515326 RepID=A0A512DEY5_9CELL|nr:Ada metal-binding domain-containing protein [Cellulomonas aerilata]GEO35039.1 DNA-3-methyladenine glycosylase [Cellulomonas aerilata]